MLFSSGSGDLTREDIHIWLLLSDSGMQICPTGAAVFVVMGRMCGHQVGASSFKLIMVLYCAAFGKPLLRTFVSPFLSRDAGHLTTLPEAMFFVGIQRKHIIHETIGQIYDHQL